MQPSYGPLAVRGRSRWATVKSWSSWRIWLGFMVVAMIRAAERLAGHQGQRVRASPDACRQGRARPRIRGSQWPECQHHSPRTPRQNFHLLLDSTTGNAGSTRIDRSFRSPFPRVWRSPRSLPGRIRFEQRIDQSRLAAASEAHSATSARRQRRIGKIC